MDIVIVTWKNLEYFKTTVKSIWNSSDTEHNIYAHVQENCAETIEFINFVNNETDYHIDFTSSDTNIGLCSGANQAAALGSGGYIYLMDDDMYLLPGWDTALYDFIEQHKTEPEFMLCSTMVEPFGNNPCAITPVSFGLHPRNFAPYKATYFARAGKKMQQSRFSDSGPYFISRVLWEKIGGYDEDFNPGIGSDNQLTKAVWDTGYKDIVTVPASLVYHFMSTTTNRMSDRAEQSRKRDDLFLEKFGITVKDFQNEQLNKDQIWS